MALQDCKLTYFGIPGRGEATRLALTIGKIPFEDNRIAFSDWPPLKATTPWGSLPLLTLKDGTEIGQQRAMVRLVGKATKLYPLDDHVAAANVDSFMDACEDIIEKTNAVGQGMEKPEKEAARLAATEKGGTVYGIFEKLDAFIAENGKDGHVVGSALTIADLYIYTNSCTFISGLFDGIPPTALDSFANIQAVRKTVRSHPAVVEWYDGLKEKSIQVPATFDAIS